MGHECIVPTSNAVLDVVEDLLQVIREIAFRKGWYPTGRSEQKKVYSRRAQQQRTDASSFVL